MNRHWMKQFEGDLEKWERMRQQDSRGVLRMRSYSVASRRSGQPFINKPAICFLDIHDLKSRPFDRLTWSRILMLPHGPHLVSEQI